jgi:EpsI family protein
MEIRRKQGLIVIVLLGICALLTLALNLSTTGRPSPIDLQSIPVVVDGYIATELPVDESVKDILQTPNVLMRDYVSPDGLRVMLSIVYYEQYRVGFHMPEGCMVGSGSVITESGTETVNGAGQCAPFLANRLVLQQRNANEHVLYYFMVDDLITSSYPAMRFHLMLRHLRRQPTGAALVRFSIRVAGEENQASLNEFKRFVSHMTSLLPSYLTVKRLQKPTPDEVGRIEFS